MQNKFSYIITHRGKDGYRLENLKAILKWIKKFKEHNIEIIIVEQDIDKVDGLDADIIHVLAYNPGIFSRSWGFNVGAKIATGNILIFGDTDVVHTYEQFNLFLHKFSDKFKAYDVVAPYNNKVIFLDSNESEQFRENLSIVTDKLPGEGSSPMMGGIVAMTSECFLKSGGWDEYFVGWGGEDCAYREHLRALGAKMHRDTNQGYHIYHERDKEKKSDYKKMHDTNRKYYFSVYLKKDKNFIEKNRSKNEAIGNPDKYR